jgi:hypothetical protein
MAQVLCGDLSWGYAFLLELDWSVTPLQYIAAASTWSFHPQGSSGLETPIFLRAAKGLQSVGLNAWWKFASMFTIPTGLRLVAVPLFSCARCRQVRGCSCMPVDVAIDLEFATFLYQ